MILLHFIIIVIFYPFLGDSLRPQIMMKNQSDVWYAEVVDRDFIRMLEIIKTLQGFKKFSGWRPRRNFPWVTQGVYCKRPIKASL